MICFSRTLRQVSNVEEAPKLWVKMSQNGQEVPEFMSTHPSDVNRIRNLEKYMEEAKAYAAK